ncbi:MAG: hypothetical protein K2P45_16250 [Eubacterium sp.]|nr:hypothetical protein [Eubacterium sp.]
MIAEKDPYIQSAYDHLQVISQDEQKRLEYEARQKAILDYNQSIFEAEQRGEKRKTIAIAEKMLELGYDPAEILTLTGITKEQLRALQANAGQKI